MEIQKITYDTKKYIRNDPNYPKTQTITDEDMNEIKSVVNNNAYKQDEDYLKLKNAVLNAETEEAKSLHVEDANKFGSLEVLGNNEQKTREGYNILDYLPNIATSRNGLTIDKDEETGYITVNGTPTANYTVISVGSAFQLNDILEDGETYTFWQENHAENNDKGMYLQIRIQKISDGSEQYINSSISNKTFTVDKSMYAYSFSIQTGTITQAGTFSNYKNRYMVYKGTDEKEFELYGATPSPGYSSEVKCLGSNKNELDLKAQSQYGITVTKNADDTLNITGTATASGNLSLLNKNIVLKANKSYTFFVKKVSGQDISNSIWLWNATDSNSEITLTLLNNIKTFTFTKDTTLSALNISVNQGDVFDITLALKLEEGTEATSYSPYNQGSTKISKINKNIYDIAKYPFTNRIAYNSSGGQVFWDGYCGILDYFPVKENTQYTFSNNLNKPILYGLVFYSEDKQVMSVISTNTTTFTTPEKCEYIRFAIQSDTLPSLAQIELGNTATSNIEHKQTDYLLYIQREMLKGDYFAKEADGWKEVHNFNKYTFTGTEDYIKSSISNDNYLRTYTRDSIISSSIMKMDGKMFATRYINIGLYSSSTADNRIACRPQLHTQISTEFLTENTAEAYKSLLTQWNNEGDPLTVFYELTTPTKLACTEEQSVVLEELSNLDLFEGVNNVITAEDIALLKLKYALDVETYVDNKIEEKLANINQQILEIVGGN